MHEFYFAWTSLLPRNQILFVNSSSNNILLQLTSPWFTVAVPSTLSVEILLDLNLFLKTLIILKRPESCVAPDSIEMEFG